MNWELEKSVTTVKVAEEEKALVERGNEMADFLNEENKRLLSEAKYTRTKIDEYLNPLETGDELYAQVEDHSADCILTGLFCDAVEKRASQTAEGCKRKRQGR